jgi:segregation and condensation protein B
MNSEELKKMIEALLFASSEPLSINTLKRALGENDTEVIENSLNDLSTEYENSRAVFIQKVRGGYQVFTKPEYDNLIKKLVDEEKKYNISRAALEVLSIVAVFQPITKPEIESIRGISSDGVVKNLLEIELLRIVGRLSTPGRPILYSTTPEFLKYFHLADAEDLKTLYEKFSKKFELEEREIIRQEEDEEGNDNTDQDQTDNAA